MIGGGGRAFRQLRYLVVKVVLVRIHEDHRRVRRGEGDDDLYAGRAHRGADQQALGH